MAGASIVVGMLVVAIMAAATLAIARRLSRFFDGSELSWPRQGLWLTLSLGASFALARFSGGWTLAAGGWTLATFILAGTAIELHGSPLRCRIAIVQLYVLCGGLSVAYLRSSDVLEGSQASAAFAFALHDQASALARPLAELLATLLRAPAWAQAGVTVGTITELACNHLLFGVMLSSFGVTTFAASYLSDRPLATPGADLLPLPSAAAVITVLAALGARATPARSVAEVGCTLVATSLAPFFVAEGAALAYRWLSLLRIRLAVITTLLGVALFVPAIAVSLASAGVLARILRLGELGPFAALADAPLQRPRLGRAVGAAALVALVFAASSAAGHLVLGRASPRLGEPALVCSDVQTSASFEKRLVSLASPRVHVSIEIDERAYDRPPRPDDLGEPCRRAGKRLCTSDEWYLACACTYPSDSEPGLKLGTNYQLPYRAEQERVQARLPAGTSTLGYDKRTETRSLLAGRSEVVSAEGPLVLVAGPSDAIDSAWTVDCRTRAMIPATVLAQRAWTFVGVRCCD